METYYSVYIDSDCYCEVTDISDRDLKRKLLRGLQKGIYRDGMLVRIIKARGSGKEIFRYVLWNRSNNVVRLVSKKDYVGWREVSNSDEIFREFQMVYGAENVFRVANEYLNWATGRMTQTGWIYKIKVKDICSKMIRRDVCERFGIWLGNVSIDRDSYLRWVEGSYSGDYHFIIIDNVFSVYPRYLNGEESRNIFEKKYF